MPCPALAPKSMACIALLVPDSTGLMRRCDPRPLHPVQALNVARGMLYLVGAPVHIISIRRLLGIVRVEMKFAALWRKSVAVTCSRKALGIACRRSVPSRRHLPRTVRVGWPPQHSHSPPLIHRDLKSPNLLVAADYTVKVRRGGWGRVRGTACRA